MMKHRIFSIVFFLLLVSSDFCFAKPKNKANKEETVSYPAWITDQGRLKLFPAEEYISQLAYGENPDVAKTKAASDLSEYIKTSVTSSVTSKYFYSEDSNKFNEERMFSENSTQTSNNTLFKVEYTNPFYYPDMGMFACVAFINRNSAFEYVKSKLEIANEIFPSKYNEALAKESTLDKILSIKDAQKSLVGFYEVYDFAKAINPSKTKKYEQIEVLAAKSISDLDDLFSTVKMNIVAKDDDAITKDSGVLVELANIFEKIGFTVQAGTLSNCFASVQVKMNITQTQKTFETYPELVVIVKEKDSVKISYSKKLKKVAGFDKDTVQRRTYLALIKELQTSFINECF